MSLPLWFALALVTGGGSELQKAGDLAAARALAAKSERPVLISLETAWCGYCRRMKREALADPRVAAMSARDFVFLELDAQDGGDGQRLARELRVKSYPTFVLADAAGSELGRITGYRSPDAFVAEVTGLLARQRQLDGRIAQRAALGDDPLAWHDLATALERGGRDAEALAAFEALYALDSAKAAQYRDLALWKMATLTAKADRGDPAIELYRRYVIAYPEGDKVETALYRIARMQQDLGRDDRAASAYRTLLERFPDGRHAVGARVQLQLLAPEAPKP